MTNGAYEWKIPTVSKATAELSKLLEPSSAKATKDDAKRADRTSRILDAVATTAVRSGLVHPVFDQESVEDMPFRSGTTIIADTSGVSQGGLDFVARYLCPVARIKVPAIVHMEIVNQADRYIQLRRQQKGRR